MIPYPLPALPPDVDSFYIYGTGEIARQYFQQLSERLGDDAVRGFIETQAKSNRLFNKPVMSLADLSHAQLQQHPILIATHAGLQAVKQALGAKGCTPRDWLEPEPPLVQLSFAPMLHIRKVLFYPAIVHQAERAAMEQMLAWYMPTNTVAVDVPQNVLPDDEWLQKMNAADVIFVWKKEELTTPLLNPFKHKLFCLDPHFYRGIEADLYRELYYFSLSPEQRAAYIQQSLMNFAVLCERQRGKTTANVYGTGPSIEQVTQFDVAGQINIICNSMVKNERLMRHLQPDILVFADPVFHFSPCAYAVKFREYFVRAIHTYDCFCVVPERNVPLLLAHFPDLQHRLIGLPTGNTFNFPSLQNFFVRSSDNILTLFMVPLASALASEVRIYGCDGRDPAETYFWQHNASVQFTDLMDTVFEMHPSFFRDRVYADYYDAHCDLLAQMIHFGEQAGKRYVCMTHSFIPILAARIN